MIVMQQAKNLCPATHRVAELITSQTLNSSAYNNETGAGIDVARL
jgi:hypothetical protein